MPDLKEIRNTLIQIQNRLNFLLNQKKINFERTQPGSPRFKEAIVSQSHNFVDTFALYMIKDEELDVEIQELRDQYYNWLEYYNKEVKRLSQYDDVLMIEFLKNELRWKWNAIDNYLGYAPDVSRHKYCKYLKNETKDDEIKEIRVR